MINYNFTENLLIYAGKIPSYHMKSSENQENMIFKQNNQKYMEKWSCLN